MYCPKCGAEIADDAVICVHCGRSLKIKPAERQEYQVSKAGIGVICGLFLGLIGLLVGYMSYPEGTNARKTFMKGWLWTIVAVTIAGILCAIIMIIISASIIRTAGGTMLINLL